MHCGTPGTGPLAGLATTVAQASVVSPCWWCEDPEPRAATLAACGSVKVRKYKSDNKKVETKWDM